MRETGVGSLTPRDARNSSATGSFLETQHHLRNLRKKRRAGSSRSGGRSAEAGTQKPWSEWTVQDLLDNADKLSPSDFYHIKANHVLRNERGSIFPDPNNKREQKAGERLDRYSQERAQRDPKWKEHFGL